jgi:hypothetical protein
VRVGLTPLMDSSDTPTLVSAEATPLGARPVMRSFSQRVGPSGARSGWAFAVRRTGCSSVPSSVCTATRETDGPREPSGTNAAVRLLIFRALSKSTRSHCPDGPLQPPVFQAVNGSPSRAA